MLRTVSLYYEKPYERNAKAVIVGIVKWKDRDAIILDHTIFYPEGGGQPGDRGFLSDALVTDTRMDGQGQLLHILQEPTTFQIGNMVDLRLDWNHRYDYMQQHTAQHLLSGTLHRLLGIGTISVHLGHGDISIDIDTGNFSESDVQLVEDAVNAIVRKSVPVVATVVSREVSQSMGLRRPVKVDGDVRVVSIGEYDSIGCGGVHVANSCELSYIQYLRTERIRGRSRTFWTAGERSVALIRENRSTVDAVGTMLSVPAEAIEESVSALQAQFAEAKHQLRASASRTAEVLLTRELETSSVSNGIPVVVFDASQWSETEYRSLPELLLPIGAIALCAVKELEEGKLAWMMALKGVDGEQSVFQAVRQNALVLIDGKGGGKPPLWQGVGNKVMQKDRFLEQVKTLYVEKLHG